MTGPLLRTAAPNQHPPAGRVHVRCDSEGRWFWFHLGCRTTKAEIGTFDDALEQAIGHAAVTPCPQPEKSFGSHIAVDCDSNSLRASWLCPWCKQYCASHNPCDCCWGAMWDEQEP